MLKSILQDFKIFLSLTIISLALIILDSFHALNFPKSFLQGITIPIQYGLYRSALSVNRQFEFILLSREAARENKALTEQLAQILSENSNLRKKLAESQAFLDQKQVLSEESFNLIPARPVGFSRFLLLDKGSDDGIKPDMAVIFKDNFIGLIKEADPKKSKVILSSDPDSRISAFSQSEEGRGKGVLFGQFGSEMLLDKILHEEPIKTGDLVYSEGREAEIPRGLILGRVSQVLEKDNEIFKTAKVKPSFDIADLEVVFIVGE